MNPASRARNAQRAPAEYSITSSNPVPREGYGLHLNWCLTSVGQRVVRRAGLEKTWRGETLQQLYCFLLGLPLLGIVRRGHKTFRKGIPILHGLSSNRPKPRHLL